MPLTAIALNCSLKSKSDEHSSTDKMIEVIAKALRRHDVTLSETIRMVDHDVKAGVTSDEGEGDAWPPIRGRILEADILIFGTTRTEERRVGQECCSTCRYRGAADK